jgi:fatty acid synthase
MLRPKVDEELHQVTVYVHDAVLAGGGDDAVQPRRSTDALIDRLDAGEPYAVAFGGQGNAWLQTLEELVSFTGIQDELATLLAEAELILEPVARELIVVLRLGSVRCSGCAPWPPRSRSEAPSS